MSIEETRARLRAFGDKLGLTLMEQGEVGFGRPCVGFLRGHVYVDYNPISMVDFEPIFPEDSRLEAPPGVRSYHKHSCVAVLAEGDPPDYGQALSQLLEWVEELEAQGELQVVSYPTGATGMQAVITGATGSAIRFKESHP